MKQFLLVSDRQICPNFDFYIVIYRSTYVGFCSIRVISTYLESNLVYHVFVSIFGTDVFSTFSLKSEEYPTFRGLNQNPSFPRMLPQRSPHKPWEYFTVQNIACVNQAIQYCNFFFTIIIY